MSHRRSKSLSPLLPKARCRLYTSAKSYFGFLLQRQAKPEDLEAQITKTVGARFAVTVPMARVGIYLVLKEVLKSRPSRKVLLSPYTIVDVVNMVLAAGGEPVFVDIDPATCAMSAEELKKKISEHTGCVLMTYLHGVAADISAIQELCRNLKVPLIEDAAQGFGMKLQQGFAGTVGDAGIYSFGMFKNINGWYGGVVVSSNREWIESIRAQVRSYPTQSSGFILKKILKGLMYDLVTQPLIFRLGTFWIFRWAFLNRVESINKHARTELDTRRRADVPDFYLRQLHPFCIWLIIQQIAQFDKANQERRNYAEIYFKNLQNVSKITLPNQEWLESSSFTHFPVQVSNREDLLRWLMKSNRDAAAQHLKNISALESFQSDLPCSNAELAAQGTVLLPCYKGYGAAQAHATAHAVSTFFSRGADA